MKNHDFTPKNHIFSNFRGGARRVVCVWGGGVPGWGGDAPGSAPVYVKFLSSNMEC